jgi:hypothetical protein
VRRPSLWPGSRSFYGFGARQYIGVGQYVPRFIYVPLCPLPYPKSKSYRINKITLKEVCIKEAAASSEKTDFGKIRAQNYLDHMNKPIMEDRYYIYPCAFSKRHQAIADNACEKQRNQTSMELL